MKKITPRILSFLLTAICMFSFLSLNAFAAEDSTLLDGMQFSIRTDKDSYNSDEDITLDIELHNTNGFAVENAQISAVLPDGLKLQSGKLTADPVTLEPDASLTLNAVASVNASAQRETTAQENNTSTPTANNSNNSDSRTNSKVSGPSTDDSTQTAMWIVLLLLCAGVAVVSFRYRKTTAKMFSILLCGLMLGTAVSPVLLRDSLTSVSAAEQFTVSVSITAAGTTYQIKAEAKYDMPETAANKGVAINTSAMAYDQAADTYMVNGQLKNLSGTLNAASTAEKLSYQVYNDHNDLISSGEITPASKWETKNPGLYIGKNRISVTAVYADDTVSQSEITVQNASLTNMLSLELDTADSDQDGVANYMEDYYGTDKNNKDSDGDGISDYDEFARTGSDPLKPDSNENQINDGDEDPDLDGLTNLEELAAGTDPLEADTDGDGLTDADELKKYHTDPNLYDTDGDGARDGKEVELGFDPLTAQDSFAFTLKTDDDTDGTAVSVDITLTGEQIESLSVAPVTNSPLLDESVAGYIAPAYEFHVDGTFDEATIHFTFDPALANDQDFEPVIYHFNEETQKLEAVETTVEGNVASAKVTHFSKYILLNKKRVDEVWAREISAARDSVVSSLPLDLALVVDGSSSMSWNDSQKLRYLACEELIAQTNANDRVAVIGFDNSARLCSAFTYDKDEAKNAIPKTYTAGGTSIYNGIIAANQQFDKQSRTAMKAMIVLTDGKDNYSYNYSTLLSETAAAGITVYTIGLGSGSNIDVSLLKRIAESTGGEYYHASSASDLAEKYGNAKDDIDLSKDSDGDGLCDYYEKGNIRLGSTKIITTDPTNPDSDGDGVKDGDEIKPVLSADGKSVEYFEYISDPMLPDTDNDGYGDAEDLDPINAFVEPLILIHGRNDNTVNTYGLLTGVADGDNDHYDSYYTLGGMLYSDIDTQRIRSVQNIHKLGYYLTTLIAKPYTANKNLFAFNYPNQDFNQFNSAKLYTYIKNLKNAAKNGTSTTFGIADIFATRSDLANDRGRFILIGHSNGGLCSRYYIENRGGSSNVSKLITIDTPHYGSGIASIGKTLDYPMGMSYPLDVELEPGSRLYGGSPYYVTNWADSARESYINNNQSPALSGNQGGVPYYAVGGYDVGHGIWPVGEIYQIPESLRDTHFSFEFTRSTASKSQFNSSIINGAQTVDSSITLDLGDSDGDNVVETPSQFGVRFDSNGNLISSVPIVCTALVVDTNWGDSMLSHFHSKTLEVTHTRRWVKTFIDA